MLATLHPDWTGSPQHFVAGLILTPLIAFALRRVASWNPWQLAVTAVMLTMGAEALVELVEYPLQYADRFHPTAYYDNVADIADTLAGAVVGGAAVGVGSARAKPPAP